VGCLKANKYEAFLRSKKAQTTDVIKKGENKQDIKMFDPQSDRIDPQSDRI